MTLNDLHHASRWLNRFERDVYSQTGEDGVIEKALELLPDRNQWCIEFGAWDGKHLSNTYRLVESANYRVVLVEGDSEKYAALCRNYPFQDRAFFVHGFVGWSETDNLDTILRKCPIPRNFDLLSIDIHGNDYHVWKAVQEFRPKLVLIEFNPTSSNRFMYVQRPDPNVNQSSSPAPIVELGKEKRYELICVIGPNLLFVDAQYFPLFNIPDNSLAVMRDESEVTTLFLGFDGSMLVDGPARLRWHNRDLKLKQPFPKLLRRYPPQYNRFQKLAYMLWERFF